MRRLLIILIVLVVAVLPSAIAAAASEARVALVIGNASYRSTRFATPANDAALIAQTLQSAGFKVTAARDLTGDRLRQIFKDFAAGLNKTGPDTVVVVYFAGSALQLEGENYLLPVDADIVKPADLSEQGLRLSDQLRALASLQLRASFLIVDGARANAASTSAWQPASGLSWIEPEANMLVAFNAAPGTVSRDLSDSYGVYARALAEMLREDNPSSGGLFERVRLRVADVSKGAQVPWHASRIQAQFAFLERGPDASPRPDSSRQMAKLRAQSMRSLGVLDAYFIALLRDTLDGYTEFLANYWSDPLSGRVRALLAARREAITWRRTCQANVPGAYWTYLERYPRAPHAVDARTILARLGTSVAVPPRFSRMEFEVPPPLPDELEYLERAMLVLDDPELALAPPPPLPAYFLGPPPPEPWNSPKPIASAGERELPVVRVAPLPADIVVPAEPKSAGLENFQQRVPIRGASGIPSMGESNVSGAVAAQPLEINNPKEFAGSSTSAAIPPLPAPRLQSEASRAMPADRATAAIIGAEPPSLSIEDQPSATPPLIVAPLAPGQLRRTQDMKNNSGVIPLPLPRPARLRKLRPAMSASQTTGGVPGLHSGSTSSTSLPAPHAALATRPKPLDQTTQPQAPSPSRSSANQLRTQVLPPRVVDAETVKPAVPPRSAPKPCVIVDGKLICR
mgnify:CR=1 FL=1